VTKGSAFIPPRSQRQIVQVKRVPGSLRLPAGFARPRLVRYNTRINFHFGENSRAMANIKMYTTTWCSDCRQAKRFLNESGIAYEEINIEEHDGAAELVMQLNAGKRKVPTFEIDGRAFNLSPYDERKLRAELNLESKR